MLYKTVFITIKLMNYENFQHNQSYEFTWNN